MFFCPSLEVLLLLLSVHLVPHDTRIVHLVADTNVNNTRIEGKINTELQVTYVMIISKLF